MGHTRHDGSAPWLSRATENPRANCTRPESHPIARQPKNNRSGLLLSGDEVALCPIGAQGKIHRHNGVGDQTERASPSQDSVLPSIHPAQDRRDPLRLRRPDRGQHPAHRAPGGDGARAVSRVVRALPVPGHEGVRMVESAVGVVPEGWEVKALGDIAREVRRGVQPSQMDPETPYFGLEYLRESPSRWPSGEPQARFKAPSWRSRRAKSSSVRSGPTSTRSASRLSMAFVLRTPS